MLVTPVFEKEQEAHEFKASLGYTVRSYLEEKKNSMEGQGDGCLGNCAAAIPDDLSSVPGTHGVEGESQVYHLVL